MAQTNCHTICQQPQTEWLLCWCFLFPLRLSLGFFCFHTRQSWDSGVYCIVGIVYNLKKEVFRPVIDGFRGYDIPYVTVGRK